MCAAFFARIFHVHLRPYGLASLGVTVWIIYTLDHLLDARKVKHVAASQRHRFHQQHFNKLVVLVVVAVIVDFLLILLIRRPILNWGIGLSLIVILYLAFQQRLKSYKELVVSFLYSAGVLLPALSLTDIQFSIAEILLMVSFMLTALINLIVFSRYDFKRDIRDQHFSVVTHFGLRRTNRILIALFVIHVISLCFLILNSIYVHEAFVLMAMNIVLFVIFQFPSNFSADDHYRLIGDAVFLFPLVYFFTPYGV